MENDILNAFKAYDIRGESPEPINAEFAYKLGKAVVEAINPKKVLVGKDMRLTSPELEDSLVKSLIEQGVEVIKIGLCSTPVFNVLMGLNQGKVDLGIMITASHNPGKYNGFKFTNSLVQPIGLDSGLDKVRDVFLTASEKSQVSNIGAVEEDKNALDRYVDFVIETVELPDDMKKINVVIDAGNGMAGLVVPKVLKKLTWLQAEELYFNLDGNFPNHEANPIKPETMTDLIAKVKETGADMGIAFDGDADRIGFVDEKGEQIPGDILTALFAKIQLKKFNCGKVVYDVRSSWTVPHTIEQAGGESDMYVVGSAMIKRHMQKEGAVFGGEMSMHYYFKEFWNVESGDYAMLVLMKYLQETGKKLSEIWKPLQKYFSSGEINFEVKDKDATLEKILNEYKSDATQFSDMDGLRFEFGDPKIGEAWWFNLRKSNTEPLIRLNLEATSEELKNEKIEELSNLING